MNSFCIGIISYFPDDAVVKKIREDRLTSLIKECDQKFKLPIIIIAQNWNNYTPPICENSELIIYNYKNKLGITLARMMLREKFLSSNYTNIILLDDDMELSSEQDCINYLNELSIGDYEYYYITEFLNNFSCISKQGFNKVNYDDDVNAELGTGFEDWIFFKRCLKYLSSKKITSKIYRKPRKEFLNDVYSTWESNMDDGLKNRNYSASRLRINHL